MITNYSAAECLKCHADKKSFNMFHAVFEYQTKLQ